MTRFVTRFRYSILIFITILKSQHPVITGCYHHLSRALLLVRHPDVFVAFFAARVVAEHEVILLLGQKLRLLLGVLRRGAVGLTHLLFEIGWVWGL